MAYSDDAGMGMIVRGRQAQAVLDAWHKRNPNAVRGQALPQIGWRARGLRGDESEMGLGRIRRLSLRTLRNAVTPPKQVRSAAQAVVRKVAQPVARTVVRTASTAARVVGRTAVKVAKPLAVVASPTGIAVAGGVAAGVLATRAIQRRNAAIRKRREAARVATAARSGAANVATVTRTNEAASGVAPEALAVSPPRETSQGTVVPSQPVVIGRPGSFQPSENDPAGTGRSAVTGSLTPAAEAAMDAGVARPAAAGEDVQPWIGRDESFMPTSVDPDGDGVREDTGGLTDGAVGLLSHEPWAEDAEALVESLSDLPDEAALGDSAPVALTTAGRNAAAATGIGTVLALGALAYVAFTQGRNKR